MKGYVPPDKLVVRDSLDDEISDDVEDDVFIRDGRSHSMCEERGLKRPLMAPRRKNGARYKKSLAFMKKRHRFWSCCEPFCYGLAAITIIIALIFLGALLLTLFPMPLQKIKGWLHKNPSPVGQPPPSAPTNGSGENLERVPCSQLSVNLVWKRVMSRVTSESPVRSADVNADGVPDIIIGYLIEEDPYDGTPATSARCFNPHTRKTGLCEGGVMAINGTNGEILWQHWTAFQVFSLSCPVDLNNDQREDCVVAGRNGLMIAINGDTGKLIWRLEDKVTAQTSQSGDSMEWDIDMYTVNVVRDLDGDDISDVVAVHVQQNSAFRFGHICVISGGTGKMLRSIPTPFREEVFVPLQIITDADGTEWLLVITGSQSTPGGVYVIRLISLMQYKSEKDFTTLYRNVASGFMVPAILTDITGDGVEDIVVASVNSTVHAFDGHTFRQLWNYAFPTSETLDSIVPGHFDHDNITDFMVKVNTGPGFPVYYYSQTMILSGQNGTTLLDTAIMDSGGSNSPLGGLSISQTFGGDFFLHWQTLCRGEVNARDAYQFITDSTFAEQSRADTCRLRYNAPTEVKLFAIARNIEPPGATILSSDDLNLQLAAINHTVTKTPHKVIPPFKHPKLFMRKFLNRGEKSSQDWTTPPNTVEQKRVDQPEKVSDFRDWGRIRTSNQDEYNSRDNYIYVPYNQESRQYPAQPPTPPKEPVLIPADTKNSDDYDIFYNDELLKRYPLRSQLPTNRDVRSKDEDIMDLESILSSEEVNNTLDDEAQTVKKVLTDAALKPILAKGHPETLWDLEMEKEASEAIKEGGTYDYPYRQVKTRRETNKDMEQNFIPFVASTGVLLPPIDRVNTPATIDFAFVLNVRESETYPPLFLPEDLACIEDKVKVFTNMNEKEILLQCLQERIPALETLTPPRPKYEMQIVIARISISCGCGKLGRDEICSQLNTIDNQRWTEFMGNLGNGLYV
ncbi:Signal recognition particle subunit SRP68 [Sergentomyia squamirostris]